jgi:hypothetical protein
VRGVPGPLSQRSFKGDIVAMSRGREQADGQVGATTEQGMHALAAQERTRVLDWCSLSCW